ncbi:hypothetical protein [Pseudomonas sp.]
MTDASTGRAVDAYRAPITSALAAKYFFSLNNGGAAAMGRAAPLFINSP